MRVWWVNQSDWYKKEKADGCVFAAKSVHPNRKLVEKARKGDLVVHYAKSHVRAVSRVQTDGTWSFNSTHEKEGWNFKTEYKELRKPIHRDRINEQIIKLRIAGGPIHDSPSVRGNVKQGYFFNFSPEGLQIIQEAAGTNWPD